jgi:pimeloyl-ACP methyl ester carboxylesterase
MDAAASSIDRATDALGVGRADVVGYSMGARVAAMMAIARPERVRSVVIAGMGAALIEGNPDASSIADAFDLESLDLVRGRSERMFRRFAEWTGSDLRALAACMRGQSGGLQPDRLSAVVSPTLFAVGSLDRLAGSPVPLAEKIPGSEVLVLEGADHMFAPGHSSFKAGVLDFLRRRP